MIILDPMAETFDARGSRFARRVEAKNSRKRRAEWRRCSKLFLAANVSRIEVACILQKISKT